MAQAKLLLDTNVVVDYLNEREPFYEKARLLMIGGRVGEFELWISSSQVTSLVYILSNGGRASEMDAVMGQLRGLRTFVNVFAASEREIDLMLAASWHDPEGYLLYEIALALRADALITRNQLDFPQGLVPVMNCDEFFRWLALPGHSMQNSLFVRTPWGDRLVSWQPRKRRNLRAVEREAKQRGGPHVSRALSTQHDTTQCA